MLIFNQRSQATATDTLALAYDERKRSRLKVTLDSGQAAGIFLERGDCLRQGDKLLAESGGVVVEIIAAAEPLLEVLAETPLLFARAAYHLGNRHVPVQLQARAAGGSLRLQADHVLAEMVRGLGCEVRAIEAPFQPEAGAYAGGHAHAGEVPGVVGANTVVSSTDLHHPGHGPHRSVPKIHEFKPR